MYKQSDQISFIQPNQLSSLSPSDSLLLASALQNKSQTLSPVMALSIGMNIPPNQKLFFVITNFLMNRLLHLNVIINY